MRSYLNLRVIFLCLLFLVGCNNGNSDKSTSRTNDTIQAIIDSLGPKQFENQLKKSGQTSRKIIYAKFRVSKILSFEKTADNKSPFYFDYSDKCEKWKLNENEIKDILQTSKIIDGHEFSYYFDILPCYYYGKVIIEDNVNADFKINSGSSTTLILPDTSYFLGYYMKKDYFILRPGLN